MDDDADVAQAVRVRGELGGELLARAVEAVVVADLHHAASRVAGSDDRVGVLQGDRQWLLDEHVQPAGERVARDPGVGHAGRRHERGVGLDGIERLLVRAECRRNREPVGQPFPHCTARIDERDRFEPRIEQGQVRQMHRLADQPGADHDDANSLPVAHVRPGAGREPEARGPVQGPYRRNSSTMRTPGVREEATRSRMAWAPDAVARSPALVMTSTSFDWTALRRCGCPMNPVPTIPSRNRGELCASDRLLK